jgi:hypothetical protein
MGQEEEVAGFGYILTFFNDVQQLKNSYAAYVGIIIQLLEKYPTNESLEKIRNLPEDERRLLLHASGSARTWIINCYTDLYGLCDLIPDLKMSDNLIQIYKKIKQRTIIDLKDVEDFNLEINKTFANATLKDIMFKINSYSKLAGSP